MNVVARAIRPLAEASATGRRPAPTHGRAPDGLRGHAPGRLSGDACVPAGTLPGVAYDEALAERIRVALGPRDGLTERKMFGGIAFLDRGNMCVGVTHDELMVRVGKTGLATALAEPGTRPMQMQGRDTGMVFVAPTAIAEDVALVIWIDRGLAISSALPAKG